MKKLLWIRVGALGDLLVSTPALFETIQSFPNHSIWIMGSKLWLSLLFPSKWPQIKGVITIENKSSHGDIYLPKGEEWFFSHSQPLGEFYKDFNVAINLRPESLRYAWQLWKAKIPIRYGSSPWCAKWLYSHNSPYLGKEPIIHERDRLLRIVEASQNNFFPIKTIKKNCQQLLEEQNKENSQPFSIEEIKKFSNQPGQASHTLASRWKQKGLVSLLEKTSNTVLDKYPDIKTPYWLINPTSSRWEKAWPKENFAQLTEKLIPYLQNKIINLYIIGAPNESDWLNFVAKNQVPIIQPQSIHDLMHIISGARQLITNTSSMQFIANSCQTPTLVLMGRTSPARWGPLKPQDTIIKGKVPESFKGNIFEEDFAGYKSISVETVLQKILSLEVFKT